MAVPNNAGEVFSNDPQFDAEHSLEDQEVAQIELMLDQIRNNWDLKAVNDLWITTDQVISVEYVDTAWYFRGLGKADLYYNRLVNNWVSKVEPTDKDAVLALRILYSTYKPSSKTNFQIVKQLKWILDRTGNDEDNVDSTQLLTILSKISEACYQLENEKNLRLFGFGLEKNEKVSGYWAQIIWAKVMDNNEDIESYAEMPLEWQIELAVKDLLSNMEPQSDKDKSNE